jgi:hypothetical protein
VKLVCGVVGTLTSSVIPSDPLISPLLTRIRC